MANCHKLFTDFIDALAITDTKRSSMMTSRENLREHIRTAFEKDHPDYKIKFYIQGSYKMETTIRTKDDECDLDDGVYISPKPDVKCSTLQQWVYDSVKGITSAAPIKKNKCIRVKYQSGYHIDLPIYVKEDLTDSDETPQLAIKNGNYEESDPKAVVDWFRNAKKDNPQLVRIVKYLKAWCDNTHGSMPPGLAMTILAVNNQKENERDDIALKDTLKAIKAQLDSEFKCVVPAAPNDDMFADYSEDKKKYIMSALETFISDANKALNEPNEKKASKIWIKYLGNRFPEGEDKENKTLTKLNELKDSILSKTARVSSSGILGNISTGVAAATHTNFGD